MASRATGDQTPAEPGVCDNHPDAPAVQSTDGGGKHSLLRFCKSCWARYIATRPVVRKG